MKKSLGAVVIAAIVVLSLGVAIWAGSGAGPKKGSSGGARVGLVRIEGSIVSGEGGMSLLGGSSVGADTVVQQLDEAAKDASIKAVVLRVNSPGGGVVASWEMGEAIKRVKAAGKPVVVSMGDAAASGGYWISAMADKIVASPGTMTGSIGVIMQLQNLTGVYDKVGYKTETFKSGAYKDIGNPGREMTDAERQLLQNMINETYEQFVQVVAEGRKMDPAKVRQVADGRIISGRQALDLGLVDELGDLKRAVKLAGEMAKLPGEPTVKELKSSSSPFEALLGSSADVSAVRQVLGYLLLGGRVSPEGMAGAQALETTQGVVR